MGSVVPDFQTRARIVVGEVPMTWTRASSFWPAAIVIPGIWVSAARTVSALAAVARCRDNQTPPFDV